MALSKSQKKYLLVAASTASLLIGAHCSYAESSHKLNVPLTKFVNDNKTAWGNLVALRMIGVTEINCGEMTEKAVTGIQHCKLVLNHDVARYYTIKSPVNAFVALSAPMNIVNIDTKPIVEYNPTHFHQHKVTKTDLEKVNVLINNYVLANIDNLPV